MKKILTIFIVMLLLPSCFFDSDNKNVNTTIKSEKINPIGFEANMNGETTISEVENSIDFTN